MQYFAVWIFCEVNYLSKVLGPDCFVSTIHPPLIYPCPKVWILLIIKQLKYRYQCKSKLFIYFKQRTGTKFGSKSKTTLTWCLDNKPRSREPLSAMSLCLPRFFYISKQAWLCKESSYFWAASISTLQLGLNRN